MVVLDCPKKCNTPCKIEYDTRLGSRAHPVMVAAYSKAVGLN